MRVCVDETGQERHRPEIYHIACVGNCIDRDDPFLIDGHYAVFDRQLIDGEYDASLQRKRHDAIVAEFARISVLKEPNFCKFSYAKVTRTLFRAIGYTRSQRMMLLPGPGIADLLFPRRQIRQPMEPQQ